MCQPLTLSALSLALHNQICHNTYVWLSDMLARLAENNSDDSPDLYLGYMALVASRFGGIQLKDLPGPQIWYADEAACVILLAQQLKRKTAVSEILSDHATFQGLLLSQQVAIIKGLSLLDGDGNLYSLAEYAAKSLNCQLFEAIAIDNAYPAKWFADEPFCQLVERVLTQGLDVKNICDLTQRQSPILLAMLSDE